MLQPFSFAGSGGQGRRNRPWIQRAKATRGFIQEQVSKGIILNGAVLLQIKRSQRAAYLRTGYGTDATGTFGLSIAFDGYRRTQFGRYEHFIHIGFSGSFYISPRTMSNNSLQSSSLKLLRASSLVMPWPFQRNVPRSR